MTSAGGPDPSRSGYEGKARPVLLAAGLAGGLLWFLEAAPPVGTGPGGETELDRLDSAGLFPTTNLWTVHLRFTKENWEAMEPEGGAGPGFGPPGFAPPASGPAGGDGPAGGPPGMSLQGTEGQRNGLAAVMGIEFPAVAGDLEFEGRHFPQVNVRYKGNGTFVQSRGSLKRSFKVDLDHSFGQFTLVGTQQQRENLSILKPWQGQNRSRDSWLPGRSR